MLLDDLVKHFATLDWVSSSTAPCFAHLRQDLFSSDIDLIIRRTRVGLEKGREGVALNWITMGFALDPDRVLKQVRRSGLFRSSKYNYQSAVLLQLIHAVLMRGSAMNLPIECIEYLKSLRIFLELSKEIRDIYWMICSRLKARRRVAVKSLLVTVEELFLSKRPANRTLKADTLDFYSIEDCAEALSFLVHAFSTITKVDDQHFNLIDETGLAEGFYDNLLVDACKLKAYYEAEILLDVFSYVACYSQKAVTLIPKDPALERSIRLGYIQFDLQSLVAYQNWEKFSHVGSLGDLAAEMYTNIGHKLIQFVDQPVSRYVLALPEAPEVIQLFKGDQLAREDVVYLTAVAREQYVTVNTLMTYSIGGQFTLHDVVKIQRFINFLRAIMCAHLEPLLQVQRDVALRSLVPVFRKEGLKELLAKFVSEPAAEGFLRAVTYDYGRLLGVFDVQYQPLISGKDYFAMPINIFCSSNLIRNLLYINREKIKESSPVDPVQSILAYALRKRMDCVAENVKLEIDGRKLEIDIVALVDDCLLIIECKRSFHPCGAHELRTSYEHILNAGVQLERLKIGLENSLVQKRLLKNIGATVENVSRVLTCVATGNRLFNGYSVNSHPVRQVYEFVNFLSSGAIVIGKKNLNLWKTERFSYSDLSAYLKGELIHADFQEAMEEVDFEYEIGSRRLVVTTYALDVKRLEDISSAKYRLHS